LTSHDVAVIRQPGSRLSLDSARDRDSARRGESRVRLHERRQLQPDSQLQASDPKTYRRFKVTGVPRQNPFVLTLSKCDVAEPLRRAARYAAPCIRVIRARIDLTAAGGILNRDIAEMLILSVQIVGKFRERCFHAGLAGLNEQPRSGRPPTRTDAETRTYASTRRNYQDWRRATVRRRLTPSTCRPQEERTKAHRADDSTTAEGLGA